MLVKCKDCPVSFEITEGEVEFFKEKGLELPKRCPPCRELKRSRNNKSANRPFEGKFDRKDQNRHHRT